MFETKKKTGPSKKKSKEAGPVKTTKAPDTEDVLAKLDDALEEVIDYSADGEKFGESSGDPDPVAVLFHVCGCF